jgi:ribosomal-protein-alanine N-acetyltransferase
MNVMQIVGVTLGENYHPSFYINLHNYWPEGFIVATIDEQIVGFALATISDSRTVRILMLGVYPFHRNKGVGSNLIDVIINQCTRRNIKLIQLEVRTKNQKAIQFYLKRKFIIYKTLFNYYKNNDNAYLMYRYL